MSKRTRTLPVRHSLSVISVGAEARDLPPAFDNEGRENYEIILPEITLEHIRERDEYLFGLFFDKNADPEDETEDAFVARLAEDRDLFKELVDDFQQGEAHDEWRNAFDPMMSFYWPVKMAYGVEAQAAASLIDEFAPVCTLVKFEHEGSAEGDFGIALSGGGMNLSDKLSVAYLCCGVCPPQELLSGLRGVIDSSYLAEVGDALKVAYSRSAKYLRARADRLDEVAEQLFEQPEPADA